jgi:hypothetical protein
MQPKSAGAPFAAHNRRANACAFRRTGINDTGYHRSPITVDRDYGSPGYGVGRGNGVGRGRGVTLGVGDGGGSLGVGDGEGVIDGVTVGVAGGVTVGVGVTGGVTVGVGVGEGVGPPAAQKISIEATGTPVTS